MVKKAVLREEHVWEEEMRLLPFGDSISLDIYYVFLDRRLCNEKDTVVEGFVTQLMPLDS